MTGKKRRALSDFECAYYHADAFMCFEGCPAICEARTVYREYLALQRCARLLRVFEKRWGKRVARVLLTEDQMREHVSFAIWDSFRALRDAIREALREAGL